MAARWWHRRGRPVTALAVAGAFVLLLGSSVAGLVLAARRPAPSPTAAQTGTLGAAAPTGGPALAASPPASIAIPSIGMAAPVNRVGGGAHGAVGVPPPDGGAITEEPAWYTASPAPGQPGASVIVGRSTSARYGPADFFALGALRPGDEIDATLGDGVVAVFTVDGVRSYRPSAFPARAVLGPAAGARLRLVTCGRRFGAARHHRSIVVYASLLSVRAPDRGGGAGIQGRPGSHRAQHRAGRAGALPAGATAARPAGGRPPPSRAGATAIAGADGER